ncbi:MAG: metallophosphoesterase [Bacteroidota bacterium]
MELQLIKRSSLLLAISLTFAACSKDGNTAESVNQRFIQSMDWNSNHAYREIVVPSDDYSILSMADIHVGGTKNLDSFFNIAKTTNPAAVVMVGDLTTGDQKDYTVFEKHLPLQDSMQLFFITGNHDLHFNGWEEFYGTLGSSSYLFTIKTPGATDLFICLDTGGGTLGDMQLKWLINILENVRPGYRHCIVFTHNNFFRSRHTDSTNLLVEELYVLLDLFTEHHVDMVVTGHDHEQDAEVFGITTYIVMDALKDGLSNAGYFQISVKNGNIGYEFENL